MNDLEMQQYLFDLNGYLVIERRLERGRGRHPEPAHR